MKHTRKSLSVLINIGMSSLLLVSLFGWLTPVQAATTWTVTNTNNSGAGSLRQTIADAASGDTINFSPGVTGTITLSSELAITKNLTITGPGADLLAISGNNTVRVFSRSAGVSFAINNLSILNGGNVTLGGAIYTAGGGTLTIANSILSGNSAYGGGGIYSSGGAMTISNSTISGNSGTYGEGLSNNGGGTVTIVNSTIANNTEPTTYGEGGGIFTNSGTITIINSTIAGNTNNSGAGIFVHSSGGGTVVLKNTLVANNAIGTNCSGAIIDGGGNLQFPGTSCGASIPTGDPKLGSLVNNGGSTLTLALQSSSAAIDAGDNTICAAAPVNNLDQRGFTRPLDGDGNGSVICDTGAYEASAFTPPTQNSSDDFEQPTFDAGWTKFEQYGSVTLSTDQAQSGVQSAKFSSTSGGQREIHLTRSLPSPTTGTVSVWFYDSAPGQNTLYVLFLVYNSDGSFSTHTGILDWEANYYHAAGPGITDSATTIPRTLGWHHFEVVVGEAGGGLYIDGTQVKSFTGSFTFDRIKLWVFGPGWRPNATYYFDNLQWSDNSPTVTSLTASSTGDADLYPGDSIAVDLTLQDANDLYAAQADCTVNPAVLQPQSAAFGNFFDPVYRLIGANNADGPAGTWTGAISQRSPAEPLTGDGLFATITYTAQAAGTTSVSCDPLLSDQNGFTQPVTFIGADITVLPFATVDGTVTYQGRTNQAGITITATSSETFTALTDSNGNFTLNLKAGDYTVVASAEGYLSKSTSVTVTSGQSVTLPNTVLQGGSVNGDNVIDIGDATLVAANFGLTVPPGDARADINDDGIVNVQDLAILGSNYGFSGDQTW